MDDKEKAQEGQCSTECCGSQKASDSAKTLVKMVIGIALIAFGIAAVIAWWGSLTTLLKGCIGLLLILAGAITIAIAKE